MSFCISSVTSTSSSNAFNALRLAAPLQNEDFSMPQLGPANLDNPSVFKRAIVNTRAYGLSAEWRTAWQKGVVVPHTASLDAHLQHALYHGVCIDICCDAPKIGANKTVLLWMLVAAVRSAIAGYPINGVLPAKFLDRTKGITVDKTTEYTTPRLYSPVHHLPWYPPATPPSTLNSTKTLSRFDPFTSLPMEMIGCVVQQCTPGDAVALSLTCKTLYSFSRPLILQIDPHAFELGERTRSYLTLCSNPRGPGKGVCKRGICERRGCHHCLCVDCPLWVRLVNWMPKYLKFCRDNRCGKFMLRRKFKNGRCYHSSSPRAPHCLLNLSYNKQRGGWSRSRNAYKHYGSNEDMKVAMDRYLVERSTGSGYGLRRRPRPSMKRVEHVNQRMRGKELTKVEMYGG